MLTANKIPDPEPIAPIKSAKIVKRPTHIPPTQAATGMYLFRIEYFRINLNKIFIKLKKKLFLPLIYLYNRL